MKKQELIHLHGLLAEVSTHCQMNGDIAPDLATYESLGVRPTSIHQSKTDHKDAVFALAEGLTADLEAVAQRETVQASAD